MTNIFTAPKSTSQQMADSLQQGRAWDSKNTEDSNLRKLINCLAVAHNQTQQRVEALDQEFRIDKTFDLIEEWEKSVGIPDACIDIYEDIVQRRADVIERLRKIPKVTLSDLQAYVDALFPEIQITLYPGVDWEHSSFEYSFEFYFISGIDLRFVLIVEIQLPISNNNFEYEWEIEFEGGVNTDIVECVLNQVIPSNVILLFTYKRY